MPAGVVIAEVVWVLGGAALTLLIGVAVAYWTVREIREMRARPPVAGRP